MPLTLPSGQRYLTACSLVCDTGEEIIFSIGSHLVVVACAVAAEGSGFCEAGLENGFVNIGAASPILLLRAESQLHIQVGRCVVVAERVPSYPRRSQERCEERVRTHHRGSSERSASFGDFNARPFLVPVDGGVGRWTKGGERG